MSIKLNMNITHDKLVKAGINWFKKDLRTNVVLSESRGFGGEIPDIIAWKSGFSFLIECKISKADFLEDQKKHFRIYPDRGMGHYRLFLCPIGLIKPEELPNGWGLLYFDGKKVNRVICWKGNIFSISEQLKQFRPDYQSEVRLLSSYIRRGKCP